MAKLSESQRHEIVERVETGERQADLAREFGVSKMAVSKLVATWKPPEQLAVLTEPEASALRRLFAEMHSPDPKPLRERWSVLDVQQVMLALRRLTGVDAQGADPDGD